MIVQAAEIALAIAGTVELQTRVTAAKAAIVTRLLCSRMSDFALRGEAKIPGLYVFSPDVSIARCAGAASTRTSASGAGHSLPHPVVRMPRAAWTGGSVQTCPSMADRHAGQG